jgi:uncharacterized protein YcbK (DUF882 family)
MLDELQEFIEGHGVRHFTAKEILRLRRLGEDESCPPRDMWPNIIPAIKLAEILREKLGHPLVVGNGYRSKATNKRVGGARRSQHMFFRALDLDLPKSHSSREHQEAFYQAACELWLRCGDGYKMGLGLYRPWRGSRVHIDAGYRKRYWKRKYVKPILESMR